MNVWISSRPDLHERTNGWCRSGSHRKIVCEADFLCGFADGFFVEASFTGFLPTIGISISFWPGPRLSN
jgi:hypothetical protein